MAAAYLTRAVYAQRLAELTEHDLDVIQRVSNLRFVTGSQLTRLCFVGSPDPKANARAARRSLLRLVQLDMLDRLARVVGGIRAGSSGFVYHLGLAGQRLAVEHGWQPERRQRRSLTPGTLFLSHTLQVSELHTLLVQTDRSRRIELLELTAEPLCHRSYDGYGGQRFILKPDSYLRVGNGNYEDSFFIEIDMGTSGSQAIERQMWFYLAHHASGIEQKNQGVYPRVLWLAPDSKRVAVIEASIRRQAPMGQALFAVGQFKDAVELIAKQAHTADDII